MHTARELYTVVLQYRRIRIRCISRNLRLFNFTVVINAFSGSIQDCFQVSGRGTDENSIETLVNEAHAWCARFGNLNLG